MKGSCMYNNIGSSLNNSISIKGGKYSIILVGGMKKQNDTWKANPRPDRNYLYPLGRRRRCRRLLRTSPSSHRSQCLIFSGCRCRRDDRSSRWCVCQNIVVVRWARLQPCSLNIIVLVKTRGCVGRARRILENIITIGSWCAGWTSDG